jgi:hypothetical protein
VNVETKEQSTGCTHIDQTSQEKLNKHYLPARKLPTTIFWGRKEVLTVEFIKVGTTITSDVYCETQKICVGPFRTKGMECRHLM